MKPSPPRPARLRLQRMLALFVTGWALFDFPLLGLGFGRGPEATLLGLPRLPVFLFFAWAALIVLLALLLEGRSPGDEEEGEAP